MVDMGIVNEISDCVKRSIYLDGQDFSIISNVLDFNTIIGNNLKTKYESLFLECIKVGIGIRENAGLNSRNYWLAANSNLLSVFKTIITFDPADCCTVNDFTYCGKITIFDSVFYFLEDDSSIRNKILFIGCGTSFQRNFVKNLITG